jgi:hypothetical protein
MRYACTGRIGIYTSDFLPVNLNLQLSFETQSLSVIMYFLQYAFEEIVVNITCNCERKKVLYVANTPLNTSFKPVMFFAQECCLNRLFERWLSFSREIWECNLFVHLSQLWVNLNKGVLGKISLQELLRGHLIVPCDVPFSPRPYPDLSPRSLWHLLVSLLDPATPRHEMLGKSESEQFTRWYLKPLQCR